MNEPIIRRKIKTENVNAISLRDALYIGGTVALIFFIVASFMLLAAMLP